MTAVSGSPLVPRLSAPGEPEKLATNLIWIGHERRADSVWTRSDFLSLCQHMRNGNAPDFFMLAFQDKDGAAGFCKSKKPNVDNRASWAWDTMTGRAKSPSGIGFYPRNPEGKSAWGAMDFDAHGGSPEEQERAARLAKGAFFYCLKNHPQLFLILSTSGNGGWHLFAFSCDLHPVEEWTLLFRQVSGFIETPIQKGILEIFPDDSHGSTGYGIRAPGSWNPKTGQHGLILFENVRALIQSLPASVSESVNHQEREDHFRTHGGDVVSPWKSTVGDFDRHDREKPPIMAVKQFSIRANRTRHAQLSKLTGHVFRQIGREVAQQIAEDQHRTANPVPQTSLEDHLRDFSEIWEGLEKAFLSELSPAEREARGKLTTENERDAFRILRGFSTHAKGGEFPFPVKHFAGRIGMAWTGVRDLRRKFCELGILRQTAPAVANRAAARFVWMADRETIP